MKSPTTLGAAAARHACASGSTDPSSSLMDSAAIYVRPFASPVGELILGSIADQLCLCYWASEHRRDTIDRRVCRNLDSEYVEGSSPVIDEAISQLQEYFSGRRRSFTVPLAYTGTPFQCQVYDVLRTIPYGTTISYGQEAIRLGRPSAVRAVANVNATNPISIFVPCHRVIGSNNTLTGYGGGLEAKQWLIELERQASCPRLPGIV